MEIDWITVIGLLAAVCTTGALVPQVVKIYKTKETADISLWMYILTSVGLILWLMYGVFLANWPIIIANGLTLVLAVLVLALKYKYG